MLVRQFNMEVAVKCLVFAIFYYSLIRSTSSSIFKDSALALDRTAASIMQNGYRVEIHNSITEDGFVLGMHRIPEGRNGVNAATRKKPVVFLMHGITGASHHWIFLGPELSVAFNLADAGFDVWMGNARGNQKSRVHLTLDPNHHQEKYDFFDFTWEEIGMFDLPAMIDYILEKTGRIKLHYIGHSQGGTVYFVMNSMRPENNQKLASAHLMAGVGYMEHFPSLALRALAANTDFLYELALRWGLVELYTEHATNSEAVVNCVDDKDLLYLCEELGLNKFMNESRISNVISLIGGSGVSIKQFAHYGQNVNSKQFRRWNFGTEGNMAAYGSPEPPLYDLSLITTNTTMHYTVNDALLDERDVLAMARDMPNAVARRIARDSFSHVDFITAADAKELVTDYIIKAIDSVDQTLPDSVSSAAETEVRPMSLFVYLTVFLFFTN